MSEFVIDKSKFEELRDKRLPVALSKINLLGNLGRSPYKSSDRERQAVVDALQEAVDGLRDAYKLIPARAAPTAPPAPPLRPTRVPQGTADGGASFESEVRWALDAIQRGDLDLAANRLKRCLSEKE